MLLLVLRLVLLIQLSGEGRAFRVLPSVLVITLQSEWHSLHFTAKETDQRSCCLSLSKVTVMPKSLGPELLWLLTATMFSSERVLCPSRAVISSHGKSAEEVKKLRYRGLRCRPWWEAGWGLFCPGLQLSLAAVVQKILYHMLLPGRSLFSQHELSTLADCQGSGVFSRVTCAPAQSPRLPLQFFIQTLTCVSRNPWATIICPHSSTRYPPPA